MRLAHARPAAVALVAGGVLVTAASGIGVAAAASAAAATGAVTAGTGESCEAVALPAPQPSSSPTQTTSPTSPAAPTTPAPTTSAPTTPAPTATPTASPSTTPSTSGTATAEPTESASSTGTASPTETASLTATTSSSATPTATATPTPTASATGSPAAPVSLCLKVVRAQASSERGQAAKWTVTAWTTGGSVSDAALKLQAVPASDTPKFSSGCGHDDGTSACDLGATDAASAQHKLQVQLTVPATASTVKSVSLTVIGSTTGSAAQLPKALKASSAVSITAPSAAKTNTKSNTKTKTTTTPGATPSPGGTGTPPDTGTVISALPVANLPGIPAASSGLSPGGNASGLFPTLSPKPSAPASASASASASATATKQAAVAQAAAREAAAREVANTSALPEGASVVDVQLAGLAALAVAFVAAVTRFALRRRPAPAKRSPGTKADSQHTLGGD
jgi:hypothetical protein